MPKYLVFKVIETDKYDDSTIPYEIKKAGFTIVHQDYAMTFVERDLNETY